MGRRAAHGRNDVAPGRVPGFAAGPAMDRLPPPPGFTPPPSQRTLAAIVFTDVVGFSARMQRDEVGTLKLLQRDFAEMRRLSIEHEGSVLKTTGDGLLLTFSSAVHAVACALAMQRQFAAEAKEPAANGGLQHRIGIHLGDILMQDQDVMGDGVNIASRLQAEAEPGGICISQTVYDVVKNKLEMQVVSLGPRELKNISQAMPVYRILLEAQALGASGSRPPIPGKPPAAAAAVPMSRRLYIGAGYVVALILIFAAGVVINRRMNKNAPVVVAAAPLPTPASAPVVAPVPPPAPTPAAVPPAESASGITDEEFQREVVRRKESMQLLRTQYLDKYDFEGLVRALNEKGGKLNIPGTSQPMVNAAEEMVKMRDWLEYVLAHYSRQRPLLVHDFSGDATKDVRVIIDPYKHLVFLENGTPKPHEWSELKPAVIGAIIVNALRETKPSPGAEVFAGARAFAQFYNVPLMREAITTIRGGRRQAN
jgi:class 3 adenylate cyclase